MDEDGVANAGAKWLCECKRSGMKRDKRENDGKFEPAFVR